MRRRRAHIAISLLFCFLVGGVGSPLVHLTVTDVAEPTPHAKFAELSTEHESPASPNFLNECPHEHDTELDCLLCNTFVLDISPGQAFFSSIRPLMSLALQRIVGHLQSKFALQLIRAPPFSLR